MPIFRPALDVRQPLPRVCLPVLLALLALGVAGCSADEAATMRADLALLGLFLYGLLVTALQAVSTLVALARRRPKGTIAYGATIFLALIAVLGGVLGVATVSELPARLRPRVGQSFLLLLGEVVVVVGAWFLATLLRYGLRQTPPPPEGEEMSHRTIVLVRVLVVGTAVLFLTSVILGYWLLIHGAPPTMPHP